MAENHGGKNSGRIPELEGLRGLLAWTVVASHIFICCGFFGPQFAGSNLLSDVAESAVDVFIVLSGFAITRLVLVEREPYRRYMWRRACRIVPAYWLALAAGIALNGTLANNLAHFLPRPEAQTYVGICELGAASPRLHVLLHTLLVHGLAPAAWLPAAPYTFLGVAWSLSLEWQFYLIAPFVVLLAIRSGKFSVALVLVCIACAILVRPILSVFSNAFLPAKALFFLIGGFSYVIVADTKRRSDIVPLFAAICGGLGLIWWIGSRRTVEAILPAALWFTVIVAASSAHLRLVGTALRSAPFQYLGRVSYSTYLFHAPVIALLQFAIWRWCQPASRMALFGFTAPLAIAGTLGASHLSWRVVERPFQRIGRKRIAATREA
jgi:peptidoglycan/LPS O-acetylase OafA/YrhL